MIDEQNASTAFEALGHPIRLRLLRLLIPHGATGITAGGIATHLDIPGTAMSFHLNRMKQAGLIHARREGRHLFYAANYAAITTIIEFLTEDCCGLAPAGCLPGCSGNRRPASSPVAEGSRSVTHGEIKS
ncbi:MAG: helix-turn-helix transcriptional regulator [Betaproteobacteria bacterium]|nr:helix-turn-helix transcriptional regulator [Betaproteobacteria bacterium]